ncbi:chalcone isomerase family protein [Desulfocicer niacini]
MVKKYILSILMVLLLNTQTDALEINGTNLPDCMKVNDENLLLNGAGVRKKYVIGFDVYVIGLYLKKFSNNALKIIDADETMALRIEILTDLITSEKFIDATLKGFDESMGKETVSIQKEIDLFLTSFANGIKNKDSFVILYQKDKGVFVYKNGKTEPEVVVKGLLLKKAIFRLWLGKRTEKHLQKLSKALLGNKGC